MSNCNVSKNKAQHQYILNLGSCYGDITLSYNTNPDDSTYAVPCRITILYKGQVFSNGFIGDPMFDNELLSKGLPAVSDTTTTGSIVFLKDNTDEETARLIIDTPLLNSSATVSLDCPICDGSDTGTGFTALCTQCREPVDCPVEASTDFLRTPGFKDGEQSTRINLDFGDGIVAVGFGGIPIDTTNLGESDTIVKRLESVEAPIQGTLNIPEVNTIPDQTTTPIQIVDLSLRSLDPVTTPFGMMDIYVGLDRSVPFIKGPSGEYMSGSGGSMSIAYDGTYTGGIWSSKFNVHVVFVAVPVGSAQSREPELVESSPGEFVFINGEPDLVRNLISENCPCIQNLIDNPPDPPIDPDSTEGHPCEGVDPACIPYLKEGFGAKDEVWKKVPEAENPALSHYIVTEDNPRVSSVGTNNCNFFIDAQAVHDAGAGVTHGVDGSRNTTTIPSSGSGLFSLSHGYTYAFDNISRKWIRVQK